MKILRIDTCADCKYGCHTQSFMVWWCSYGVVDGEHIENIEDKDIIPDWCPLYDVDPTILRVLAEKIEPGEAHDDCIKLARYLEGEDEDTQN